MKILQILPANPGIKAQIQGQMSLPIEFWALVEDESGGRSIQGMVLNTQTQQFVRALDLPGFQKYLR